MVGLIQNWKMRDDLSQGKENFLNHQESDGNGKLYCLHWPRKKKSNNKRVVKLEKLLFQRLAYNNRTDKHKW